MLVYSEKAKIAREFWNRIVALTAVNADVPEDLVAEFLGALRDTFLPYERVLEIRGESCSADDAHSKAVVFFVMSASYQPTRSRGRPRLADVVADEISSVLQLLEPELGNFVLFDHIAEEIVSFARRGHIWRATALLKGFQLNLEPEYQSAVNDLIIAPLLVDSGDYFSDRCKSWLYNHFPWLQEIQSDEENEIDAGAEPELPCRPRVVAGHYAPVFEDLSSSSDALSCPPDTPPPLVLGEHSNPDLPRIIDLVSEDERIPSPSFGEIVDLVSGADSVVRDHMGPKPGDISHETLLPVSLSDAELAALVVEPSVSEAPLACPFPDENDRPLKRSRTRASEPSMAIEFLLAADPPMF
jgi:hypothetical protein